MRHALLLLGTGLLAGCIDDGDKPIEETGAGLTDTAISGDTAPVDHGDGTITGTVQVQLYETDADGEITELSWDDYGQPYPFGAIFVAAYTLDETTNQTTYLDSMVIPAPSTAGDPYTLNVDLDDASSVRVYASLDYSTDGVIGTSDPIGVYPGMVPLVEGTTVPDVDLIIEAPISTGGGTDTGGGGGEAVVLSGDVAITSPWTAGDGKVMLYDSAGNGPAYITSFTTVSDGSGGGTSSYALPVGANFGAGRLLGAWDSNQNGLIEPSDTWGAYVVGGASGNPITVGDTSRSGLDVSIPFGTPPAVVPFVEVGGNLTYDQDFSTLPVGAIVYVTALRTRPSVDFSVADLVRGYDWESFTGADLAGMTIPYTLLTPANAVAYLLAYADSDGDGVLNEVGEPVGSYGRSGRVATGTTNQLGIDVPLHPVTE